MRPATHPVSDGAQIALDTNPCLVARGAGLRRDIRQRRVVASASGRPSDKASVPKKWSGEESWPRKLLSAHGSEQKTIYTMRLRTNTQRGSGIDTQSAGVQLGLINKDGDCFLHWVSPVNDPECNLAELQKVCEVEDRSLGINCPLALSSTTQAAKSGLMAELRFQPGSVDEVSVLGPEMGPLAGLLAGPQSDSWQPDEIIIKSSRTGHVDRFVCREKIGEGQPQGAVVLTPVPEDAVVYGSGTHTMVLSKDQAKVLHALGMFDYDAYKGRLTVTTAALVSIGTVSATLAYGWDAAAPFAVGGLAGLTYLVLLQRSVDAIGGPTPYTPRPQSRFMQAISGGYARFTFVIVATLISIHALDLTSGNHDQVHAAATTLKFFTGAAGFLMYKLAVIGVTALPPRKHNGNGGTSPDKRVPLDRSS